MRCFCQWLTQPDGTMIEQSESRAAPLTAVAWYASADALTPGAISGSRSPAKRGYGTMWHVSQACHRGLLKQDDLNMVTFDMVVEPDPYGPVVH